jgi:hypothetical protein
MSIDNPNISSIFLEFNEYLSQETLKKEISAEFLKGKIAMADITGNYSELADNCEE